MSVWRARSLTDEMVGRGDVCVVGRAWFLHQDVRAERHEWNGKIDGFTTVV